MKTASDLGRCPRSVAVVLAIGAVLGAVSGLDLAFFFWLLVALPALLLLAIVALLALFHEFDRGDPTRVARRGWRLAVTLAAMPMLMMLGGLSQFVDVARYAEGLRAEARSHEHRELPDLAIVRTGSSFLSSWGLLYDETGEITLPCGTQSEAWLQGAIQAHLGDTCDLHIGRVIGPYYRWAQ